jgi:MinD superfamily P-loop ATPase
VDVCLTFNETSEGSGGTGRREISLAEVEDIFREAKEKHLVIRPFRSDADRRVVDGICFCCDDCCGYFLDEDEVCDRGFFEERTDAEECSDCGICADVCYFGARGMDGDTLAPAPENCYGCGLCVDVCPAGCVEMAPRA